MLLGLIPFSHARFSCFFTDGACLLSNLAWGSSPLNIWRGFFLFPYVLFFCSFVVRFLGGGNVSHITNSMKAIDIDIIVVVMISMITFDSNVIIIILINILFIILTH